MEKGSIWGGGDKLAVDQAGGASQTTSSRASTNHKALKKRDLARELMHTHLELANHVL